MDSSDSSASDSDSSVSSGSDVEESFDVESMLEALPVMQRKPLPRQLEWARKPLEVLSRAAWVSDKWKDREDWCHDRGGDPLRCAAGKHVGSAVEGALGLADPWALGLSGAVAGLPGGPWGVGVGALSGAALGESIARVSGDVSRRVADAVMGVGGDEDDKSDDE